MDELSRMIANKCSDNYALSCLRQELNAIRWKDMSSDTDYSKSIKQLEDAIAVLERPPRSKREVFTAPSVDEVEEYCDERDNGINPQAFVDFYETRGWKVGKEKMKDWKAAIRTWENNKKEREHAQNPSSERYTTVKKDFRSGGIYESM
jgi:hypothetical protein